MKERINIIPSRRGLSDRIGNDNSQNRRNFYKLSQLQYDVLWLSSCGTCQICGEIPEKEMDLVIDHDHITGKIRGLLCFNCNNGIGRLQDSVGILNKAINYLTCENPLSHSVKI